jgi:hypothetical protein
MLTNKDGIQFAHNDIGAAVLAEVPEATDWTAGAWARVDGQRVTVHTQTRESAPDTFDGPTVELTYWSA